jgi:5'-3' exonuclease
LGGVKFWQKKIRNKQKAKMGPHGFLPWVRSHGYQPKKVYVGTTARLLVDAKNLIYTLAYAVPSTDPDFHQSVATLLLNRLSHFSFVTLVNDGKIGESHPKFATVCKRKDTKAKQQENFKRRKIEVETTEHPFFVRVDQEEEKQDTTVVTAAVNNGKIHADLERQARGARAITLDDSIAILTLVQAQQRGNIFYMQCDEGEADPILMTMADEFDFVVSNDTDLLVGRVRNLLYKAFTSEQAVYNGEDICKCLKITFAQLQQIVSLSGNDYMPGIRGMGLVKAYPLIQKYKTCENMLRKWTPKERKGFTVPEDILQKVCESVALYQWISKEE